MTRIITLAAAIALSASAGLAQTGGQTGSATQGSHKVAANHPNTGAKHGRRTTRRRGVRATAHTTPTSGMGEGTTNSGMTEATTPH